MNSRICSALIMMLVFAACKKKNCECNHAIPNAYPHEPVAELKFILVDKNTGQEINYNTNTFFPVEGIHMHDADGLGQLTGLTYAGNNFFTAYIARYQSYKLFMREGREEELKFILGNTDNCCKLNIKTVLFNNNTVCNNCDTIPVIKLPVE